MAPPLTRAGNSKIGTCPHGLPIGACPICNGMGGGGGSVKKNNKPREMTWNECYAVGQMLKAQKQARENTKKLFAAQDLKAHLESVQTQLNALKAAAVKNLPSPIAKTVIFFADKVLLPVAKVVQAVTSAVQNIANALHKFTDNIKQKAAEIMDKLTAMFGEAKAAIQKKIDEKFKDLKKKVFNLFGIAASENEEDEEVKKVEEEKRLFELNTAKEALFETFENPEILNQQESEETE